MVTLYPLGTFSIVGVWQSNLEYTQNDSFTKELTLCNYSGIITILESKLEYP